LGKITDHIRGIVFWLLWTLVGTFEGGIWGVVIIYYSQLSYHDIIIFFAIGAIGTLFFLGISIWKIYEIVKERRNIK
jgi:hypothetical protein